MKNETRSLLKELEALSDQRDVPKLIETRAANIITSAINLIEMIGKHYSPEKAELLERKLLVAIKNKDNERFAKSLRRKT